MRTVAPSALHISGLDNCMEGGRECGWLEVVEMTVWDMVVQNGRRQGFSTNKMADVAGSPSEYAARCSDAP